MTDLHINATVTEVGVSMGDHAQDIVRAVMVSPDDTIASIVARCWPSDYVGHKQPRKYQDTAYLTIRVVGMEAS